MKLGANGAPRCYLERQKDVHRYISKVPNERKEEGGSNGFPKIWFAHYSNPSHPTLAHSSFSPSSASSSSRPSQELWAKTLEDCRIGRGVLPGLWLQSAVDPVMSVMYVRACACCDREKQRCSMCVPLPRADDRWRTRMELSSPSVHGTGACHASSRSATKLHILSNLPSRPLGTGRSLGSPSHQIPPILIEGSAVARLIN
ncbi:hypothetical protein B0I35DRAFT_273677 [Stachybotrys elegans]|uniref:Uncharacterized protein n=1 Tax=Stachybotrys elegans TaxID=80388 RepID=A0A8K0WP60_9HYPO|nr:hypothetical protein B0I35DRAFT_273677 [Stachybotrys elegans]